MCLHLSPSSSTSWFLNVWMQPTGGGKGSSDDSQVLPSGWFFRLPVQHPVGQLLGPRDRRERKAEMFIP